MDSKGDNVSYGEDIGEPEKIEISKNKFSESHQNTNGEHPEIEPSEDIIEGNQGMDQSPENINEERPEIEQSPENIIGEQREIEPPSSEEHLRPNKEVKDSSLILNDEPPEKQGRPNEPNESNTRNEERKREEVQVHVIEKKNEIKEEKKEPEKERIEIIPFTVDQSYKQALKLALEQKKHLRPTTLFQPEYLDITKDSATLLKESEEREKREIEENNQQREFDEIDKLNQYKEAHSIGHTMIQDPLALFADAKKLFIDQFYKVSDLFVICPMYFNYRISLQYDNPNESHYLFRTNEISPVFQHNFCPNQAREITIKLDNFIPGEDDEKTQTFVYIKKKYRCAISCFCACCTRPEFEVTSLATNFGKIEEIRTLCDPKIHIYDANDDLKYFISASCCQWGYFCRDRFCDNLKCGKCDFYIYALADEKMKSHIGSITKIHRSGKRWGPDYDQLEIVFPDNCITQDKVLIMAAALLIEYLYFQNNTNWKRCNGNPKFYRPK